MRNTLLAKLVQRQLYELGLDLLQLFSSPYKRTTQPELNEGSVGSAGLRPGKLISLHI